MHRTKFFITGGGTGGHIYPAMAVVKELLAGGVLKEDIFYLGSKDNLEFDIVKKEGLNFLSYKVIGMPRKVSPKLRSGISNATSKIAGSFGNVGKKIEKMARHIGFNVLICDPPRAEKEGPGGFCSLEHLLLNSRVVTLHVPLNETTRGMADENFFNLMRPGAFFINTSRGEVMSDRALMDAVPKLGPVIIDTWNNEPDINRELLDMTDIATPHIAGYSYLGKQNGTASSVQAVARHFGIEPLYDFFPSGEGPDSEPVHLDLRGKNQGEITSILQYNYPIFTDDFMLRIDPGSFERLRTEYRYRREICID